MLVVFLFASGQVMSLSTTDAQTLVCLRREFLNFPI